MAGEEQESVARKSGAQPGNKNQVRSKPWRDAIDRAIAQGDGKKLRDAAEKLLELAAAGDIGAIRELGDRIDGKAIQQIIGDSENPLQVVIHR